MPEDASLDEFASSEKADESEKDESADSEPVEPELADSETPGDSTGRPEEASAEQSKETDASNVEPAVSTFAWSPEGGECADCGASAERRWRGEGQRDGDLVCADCKEW